MTTAPSRNQWLTIPAGYTFRRPGRLGETVGAFLNRSAARRAFDALTDEYAEREGSTAAGVWDYYRTFLAPTAGRLRVLDVGTGSGCRTAVHSTNADADFTAIDYDFGLLRFGASRTAPPASIRFVQADAGHLPFATETFYVCLCENSLEHLSRPDLAIAEMSRILRPNGCLFAVFPPWLGPFSGHLRFLTSLPWIHLLPRRVLLWIIIAIHYPNLKQEPRSFEEHASALVDKLSAHLNGWSLARLFRAFVASTDLEPVDAYALGEWGVCRVLRFLPWAGELFTSSVYVVYRKRRDGRLPARRLVAYNSVLAEMMRRRLHASTP